MKKSVPAFIYTSICCNLNANKTACVRPRDKKEALTNSLGSWRCTGCKRPCKVSRHKNPEAHI
jgi:hypothetical protein